MALCIGGTAHNHAQPESPPLEVVQHEETIKRLIEELTNGSRSLDSFLSSISHCVVSFDYSLYCLLHIFVGENCCMLAHLDILGTCTEILDILALDILDLDILGPTR